MVMLFKNVKYNNMCITPDLSELEMLLQAILSRDQPPFLLRLSE